jgi:hypothetical protein
MPMRATSANSSWLRISRTTAISSFSSRLLGCLPGSRGSFRFRAQPSCIALKKTLELRISNLHLCAIESASSNIKVEGARYPQWLVPMIGR